MRLQARLAAVERRDVAELAAIGAARGELQRAEQVFLERQLVVGRQREVAERRRGPWSRAPPGRAAGRGRRRGSRPAGRWRRRARRCGDSRSSRYFSGAPEAEEPPSAVTLPWRLGARVDVADLRLLHMHAADEHRVGPGEIRVGRLAEVLVDEAHLPALRQVGGDHQQALRRHEGLHVHQRVGAREGAERGGVGGEDAQDASFLITGTVQRKRSLLVRVGRDLIVDSVTRISSGHRRLRPACAGA